MRALVALAGGAVSAMAPGSAARIMLNTGAKGARSERRARRLLETAGFHVIRSAASKGVADLVAWDDVSIRLISVKSGTKYASAIEREALRQLPRPANSTVEIWRFRDGCTTPSVETL